MTLMINENLSLEKCPALVLNADYRPLSYYPLSLWSWQDAIKSVFLDRVSIVSHYDRMIRSPSFSMQLPSVIVAQIQILQDLMFFYEISLVVNIVEVMMN